MFSVGQQVWAHGTTNALWERLCGSAAGLWEFLPEVAHSPWCTLMLIVSFFIVSRWPCLQGAFPCSNTTLRCIKHPLWQHYKNLYNAKILNSHQVHMTAVATTSYPQGRFWAWPRDGLQRTQFPSNFFTKFHCKLNFIEECWGSAKQLYHLNPELPHKYVLKQITLATLNSEPLENNFLLFF